MPNLQYNPIALFFNNISARSVRCTFERSYNTFLFIGDSYIVECGFVTQVYLFAVHKKDIPFLRRSYKTDLHIQGYTQSAMRITGKCKRTVSRGEHNTSMHNAKTIQHLLPYGKV